MVKERQSDSGHDLEMNVERIYSALSLSFNIRSPSQTTEMQIVRRCTYAPLRFLLLPMHLFTRNCVEPCGLGSSLVIGKREQKINKNLCHSVEGS